MYKVLRFFITVFCVAPLFSASAAIKIKKAAPVTTEASKSSDNNASLVPSVLGLVSGAMAINAKQKVLSKECVPSTKEMTFVDNAMKEWAKTGSAVYTSGSTISGREPCSTSDGYSVDIKVSIPAGLKPCYNSFIGTGDSDKIWEFFPKTGKGSYCKDGEQSCPGKEIEVYDVYDLFAKIDFGPADYNPKEAKMAAKLLNKVESCTKSKLSAKKKAIWGEFLVETAGSLGQKTSTDTIMEQVGTISSSGNLGAVSSLSSIATQFMNK